MTYILPYILQLYAFHFQIQPCKGPVGGKVHLTQKKNTFHFQIYTSHSKETRSVVKSVHSISKFNHTTDWPARKYIYRKKKNEFINPVRRPVF